MNMCKSWSGKVASRTASLPALGKYNGNATVGKEIAIGRYANANAKVKRESLDNKLNGLVSDMQMSREHWRLLLGDSKSRRSSSVGAEPFSGINEFGNFKERPRPTEGNTSSNTYITRERSDSNGNAGGSPRNGGRGGGKKRGSKKSKREIDALKLTLGKGGRHRNDRDPQNVLNLRFSGLDGADNLWIVKPIDANRGQGISVEQDFIDILKNKASGKQYGHLANPSANS